MQWPFGKMPIDMHRHPEPWQAGASYQVSGSPVLAATALLITPHRHTRAW
jgi:hypothetical protein